MSEKKKKTKGFVQSLPSGQKNRRERRSGFKLGQEESMRRVKRAQRYKMLQARANEIKEKKPKTFQQDKEFTDLFTEMKEILSYKGGFNTTPKKKKR
jgi:hypothetical protein